MLPLKQRHVIEATSATPRIQDYALIGDGRSVALVSRAGSIDWLSWPTFDSPSMFAAILDQRIGGSWSITPNEPARSQRSYIEGTNVLQTHFQTASGAIRVTDFMPAMAEEEKRDMLLPEHELVRYVEGVKGEVELIVHFDPRPNYGRAKFVMRSTERLGIRVEARSGLIALHSGIEFGPVTDSGIFARVRLPAGEAVSFSLTHASDGPAVLPALGDVVVKKLALTIDWWKRWSARTTYRGPNRNQVIRSALALKLMSYAPSGALIAAPTTSLPERMGGDRNWDYRFCWLRDAAFAARALFGLGYLEEGQAFVSWLLHATRLTRPELRVAYDVYGRSIPKETELSHFSGYGDSRPIRIGNAARDQLQLDVYGAVIEAVMHFLRCGGKLDRETQRMLRHFGNYVCRHWREPDNGIWETRDTPQHFTHSRLLCWVALDRLIAMQLQGQCHGIPAEEFKKQREAIRRDIEVRGWNPTLKSYSQVLDGDTVDSTLLLFAFHGFDEPSSWRMQQTYDRILERLGAGPGLLYRNEQNSGGREGAFALCSFWVAEFLAHGGGSLEQTRDQFDRTLTFANDVGLFAEQIDPTSGAALGNFPQAFTHMGLINAALSLAERERIEANGAVHMAGGNEISLDSVRRPMFALEVRS